MFETVLSRFDKSGHSGQNQNTITPLNGKKNMMLYNKNFPESGRLIGNDTSINIGVLSRM